MNSRARAVFLLGSICLAAVSPLATGAEISGEFIEAHSGRLTILFRKLDPGHAAIAPIRDLWEHGERREAASRLAAYFAEKKFDSGLLRPLHLPEDVSGHARAVRDDRFFLLNAFHTVSRRPDGGIDWRDRGPGGDKERAWMLNRHAVFPVLAEAWLATGDPAHGERLRSLWRDWILANPYPDRLTFSAPWRALEVARRVLNSWTHVFYGYPVLDAETRLLVLSSIPDHADALYEHASFWGGNHLITEKLALLTLGMAWPEFGMAASWREHAVEVLTRQFLDQTYPDGSYKELSNHYQRVVLYNAWYFLKLLAGEDPDFRNRPVTGRIEAMCRFLAGVMRPDGTGPLNNASDLENNAAFLLEVREFFNRPDWLYMATNGRQGVKPEAGPSLPPGWAGQAILRSGWERDAHWVYFDAGPYGTAHQHVDRFHVSACLNGRPWLVDTGRYTYKPGPWRARFKGPEGHNLILLDDRPALQAPREITAPLRIAFHETDAFAFAGATGAFQPASPMAPAIPWTRAVILGKSGFLLVIDHITTFSDRRVRARWHFHPSVPAGAADRSVSLVAPARPLERRITTGHYSPFYNRKEACPVLEFSGQISQPTTLLWVIHDPDKEPPGIQIHSPEGAPVMELLVTVPGKGPQILRLKLHPFPEWVGGQGSRD